MAEWVAQLCVAIVIPQRLNSLPIPNHDAPARISEQSVSLSGAAELLAIQAHLGTEGLQAHNLCHVVEDELRLFEL